MKVEINDCTPCERSLAKVVTLLETLKTETLSSRALEQIRDLRISLIVTGKHLVEKRIAEAEPIGRDHPIRT